MRSSRGTLEWKSTKKKGICLRKMRVDRNQQEAVPAESSVRGGVPVIEKLRIVKLEDQRLEGVDSKSVIAC